MTTLEKAREHWKSIYLMYGKGKAELCAYQEYIAISQGRKLPKYTKVKAVYKQEAAHTARLF